MSCPSRQRENGPGGDVPEFPSDMRGGVRGGCPPSPCPAPYFTAIMPVEVRAANCGRYMSSTLAAGWTYVPGVTARTT